MSIKSERILGAIEKITKKDGFVNFGHTFLPRTSKGDSNYIGDIIRVELNGKNTNGEDFFYNVIAPTFYNFQIKLCSMFQGISKMPL